jgi:hypothetical protein
MSLPWKRDQEHVDDIASAPQPEHPRVVTAAHPGSGIVLDRSQENLLPSHAITFGWIGTLKFHVRCGKRQGTDGLTIRCRTG